MATQVWDAGLVEVQGEAAALTPTTTAAYQAIKPGFKEVAVFCSALTQMVICPKLVHAVYYNASTYVDYVAQAVDGVSTTHVPLDAMATTHYLYLGTVEPVRGFYFTIDGTNKNAVTATLDMEYCSTALSESASIAFTDVASDSDGTNSGSATLAVSGAYTFTLPSVRRSFLGTWAEKLFTKCYWTRFAPSATLSTTIDVTAIMPIYQLAPTSGRWLQASVEYIIPLDPAKTSGFVFYAASGAPNVYVSWHK